MNLDGLTSWLLGAANLARWWETPQRALFWAPVVPLPGWATPGALLASILALIVLSGVALASLGLFLTAALALHLLLTQVLGVSLTLSLR